MTVVRPEESVDSRANRYALHCFCITMMAFTVAWILNQLNIFIVDKALMNTGFAVALILFVVCLGCCRLLGLNKPVTKYVLLYFIISITTVISTQLTYHAVLLSAFPIMYSVMYQNTKRMTWYTYGLTVCSIIIIVFAGYRFGLCDANMALLTSKPLSAYVAENGTFLLQQVNNSPVLTLSLYFIFPRCILCALFVPVSINISNIIADSRMREEEMRVLAEIDGMTGLYNKSKYLELVAQPYTAEEHIGVIYWDVNGLKRINDNYGHENGDKLILMISDSIKKISSAADKAYRIGGDEFVMILRGADDAMLQQKVKIWQESIAGLTVGDGEAVTASVGYACGSGSELEELIKQADENMYRNKRKYYAEKATACEENV